MQYVVLFASKKDTSDRYWRTFKSLKEAHTYRDYMDENEWIK